jgi:hypothetical protein
MKFIFPWGFILWYPEKAKVGTKVSTSTSDGIWDGVCLACAILLSREPIKSGGCVGLATR